MNDAVSWKADAAEKLPDGSVRRDERVAIGALCRESFVVVAAIGLATGGAAAFYEWSPVDDPIDVVGVPLLTGYSEATEQWSWYVFVALVVVLTAVLRQVSSRLPDRMIGTTGAVALVLPLSAIAWSEAAWALIPATGVGVLAYLSGAGFWRAVVRRGAWSLSTTLVGLAIWLAGFSDIPIVIAERWQSLAAVGCGAALLWWQNRGRVARGQGTSLDWLHQAAALISVAGILTAEWRVQLLALAGGAAFLFGVQAAIRAESDTVWSQPQWLFAVAFLCGVLYLSNRWYALGDVQPALSVAGGAAAAMLARRAVPLDFGLRLARSVANIEDRLRPASWLPVLAIAAVAILAFRKPWLGVLATTLMLTVHCVRTGRRFHVPLACLVAVLVCPLVLPSGHRGGLDPFHDGQIFLAAWEFETGRALYSDVFVQRSYEFMVACLFRWFLSPNVDSYFVGMGLLSFLPIGGACFLAFAWTRSIVWGLGTALVIAAWPDLSGRLGVHLWVAAGAILVLRSRCRWRACWLIPLGALSGLLGYDVFVSFIAALGLVVFAGGFCRYTARASGGLALAGIRFVEAIIVVAIPAGSFTTLIFFWQGPASAVAYWELLIDNARSFAAFCGLPLPWRDGWLRARLVSAMVVCGLWTSWGVARWARLRPGRRRAWVFLLAQFALMASRGLARSDAPHLDAVIYPGIVLASIGLFESLRFLRRAGVRSILTQLRVTAFSVAAVSCWITPHGDVGPWQFVRYVRSAATNTSHEPPAPEFVHQRVGAGEYLWEVENAMLTYAARRHNPTRQTLGYCICSPREQRITVDALRRRPPRLIAWQHTSGSDGIANPLRFYLISQFVYRHYRPSEQLGFLEPAEPGWQEHQELDPAFLGRLDMGWLPARWGSDRLSRLGDRVAARKLLHTDNSPAASANRAEWKIPAGVSPRDYNYLRLDLAARSPARSDRAATAVLEFAPNVGQFESSSSISFNVALSESTQTYLIPIGTSPGWAWRTKMARLSVEFRQADAEIHWPVDAELLRVDEFASPARHVAE